MKEKIALEICFLTLRSNLFLSALGAEALSRLGWESNHHFALVSDNLISEKDKPGRSSSPSLPPQVLLPLSAMLFFVFHSDCD